MYVSDNRISENVELSPSGLLMSQKKGKKEVYSEIVAFGYMIESLIISPSSHSTREGE